MPLSADLLKEHSALLKELKEYFEAERCSECGFIKCGSWECAIIKSERIEFKYEAMEHERYLNELYE